MKYVLKKQDNQVENVQNFLKNQGISGRTLKKIRQGQGQIFLDHTKAVTMRTKITKDAEITLEIQPEKVDPNVFQSSLPFEIVEEDDYFLAVNKPANLTSVPGPNDSKNTLTNRVLGYGQRQVKPYVPHILTRLDYDTSGLVLFAKSNFIQSMLQQQISQHTMKKIYYALISGHLDKKHGIIDYPLAKESFESPRRVVDQNGKTAKTEYWVINEYDDASLLKVRLHTGRTHQIRAHFAALGHPLIGDKLYGGDTTLLKRQALHAYQLTLNDPFTKQSQIFTAPIATDLKKVIDLLDKN